MEKFFQHTTTKKKNVRLDFFFVEFIAYLWDWFFIRFWWVGDTGLKFWISLGIRFNWTWAGARKFIICTGDYGRGRHIIFAISIWVVLCRRRRLRCRWNTHFAIKFFRISLSYILHFCKSLLSKHIQLWLNTQIKHTKHFFLIELAI